jgi:hypothetical protein
MMRDGRIRGSFSSFGRLTRVAMTKRRGAPECSYGKSTTLTGLSSKIGAKAEVGDERRRMELLRGVDARRGRIKLQRQPGQSLIISVQAYSHSVSPPRIITSAFLIFCGEIRNYPVQDTRT